MSQTYEVTAVPEILKSQTLGGSIRVEFLDYGMALNEALMDKDKKKNHVVFTVSFAAPVSGAQAVRISMDLHMDATGAGQMKVKPLGYTNESRSALAHFSFNLASPLTLGQLLDVATSQNMHFFNFISTNEGAFMGCRDFMWLHSSTPVVQCTHLQIVAPNTSTNCRMPD